MFVLVETVSFFSIPKALVRKSLSNAISFAVLWLHIGFAVESGDNDFPS
jgi:hypothetical protein